jgi:hypothetical protein
MENNYRQQDGGNYREVREAVFVDPFAGEAVSEDAGQGDWGGGLLNWGIPQEQQQQGSVEGEYDPGIEYDPGFIPEGEYTPGSEYDPGFVPEGEHTPGSEYDPGFIPESGDGPGSEYEGGYDPIFTWGGFEDDVVAQEPADVPAAAPSGGTPPLETVGPAEAAGDPEIEMYSDDVGQASADTGDNDIEMASEYVGQAEDEAAQEPNDAPDPSGGTPLPEYAEQASADNSGDPEIEMPPVVFERTGADNGVNPDDIEIHDDSGQANADSGVNPDDIEMLSDDAGQAGAGDGETGEIEITPEEAAAIPAQPDAAGDGEIEMTGNEEIEITADGEVKLVGETVGDVSIGYPRPVSEDEALRKQEHAHEMELGEFHSVDELRAYYKELIKDSYERDPEMSLEMRDEALANLDKVEANTEGYASLLDGARSLLKERDLRDERSAELAARYDDVSDGNHPRHAFSSEEYLADYYKTLYKQLNGSDQDPDMAGLDTYDKLRTGVYELWEQRDNVFDKYDREQPSAGKDESHKDDSAEDGADRNYRFFFGTEDSDKGVETEMTPEEAGQASAGDDGPIGIIGAFRELKARHAGDGEIEMPPVVFGPADTGDGETEEIEITPGEVAHLEAQEAYRQVLEARYADQLEFMGFGSHPDADQNYRELADQYKVLYKALSDGKARHLEGTDPDLEGVDTYEELKTEFYKLLHTRDLHLEEQQLEARYGKQVAEDPYLQTDEQIRDYYNNLYETLYGEAPNMSGLGTYEEIKSRLYKLMERRDLDLRQHEPAQPTEEDESNTGDSVEPPVIDSDQAVLEGYHHHDAGHEYVADYGDDLWG